MVYFNQRISILMIRIGCMGLSAAFVRTTSMDFTVSIPDVTWPNTVCLLFNHGYEISINESRVKVLNDE